MLSLNAKGFFILPAVVVERKSQSKSQLFPQSAYKLKYYAVFRATPELLEIRNDYW